MYISLPIQYCPESRDFGPRHDPRSYPSGDLASLVSVSLHHSSAVRVDVLISTSLRSSPGFHWLDSSGESKRFFPYWFVRRLAAFFPQQRILVLKDQKKRRHMSTRPNSPVRWPPPSAPFRSPVKKTTWQAAASLDEPLRKFNRTTIWSNGMYSLSHCPRRHLPRLLVQTRPVSFLSTFSSASVHRVRRDPG